VPTEPIPKGARLPRLLAGVVAPTRGRRLRGRSPVCASLLVAAFVLASCGGGRPDSKSQSTSSAASVAALINTGIAQASAKHYVQADTTFRDILVLSPKNKFAWYNLGLIAQLQKRSASALADYSNALAADPAYTPAMYNKAILLERGAPRSALALYRHITSIDPRASTAYLRESFVYGRLGDRSKASQARSKAIALDSRLSTVTSPAP
jgi:Tfp pilus assembly protein PilF